MVCYIINSIESGIEPKFVEYVIRCRNSKILVLVILLYIDIHPYLYIYLFCYVIAICYGIRSFLPNKVTSMVVMERSRRGGEEGCKFGDNCALFKNINYS